MERILITNDDGIDAPGLKALESALAAVGDVVAVAPDCERSGSSQSLTLYQPLRVKALDDHHFAVNGTPTDAVILALYQILAEKPALVVSGINPGANLGENLIYSGTVGAAQEAALHRVPAIAVSLATRRSRDFSAAADFVAELAEKVLREGLEPGVCLNVNVPRGEIRGVRLTRQSQKISQNLIRQDEDPRGNPYFWLDETLVERHAEPDSDYAAIFDHEISVTPLHVDHTHYASLNHLSSWLPELGQLKKL